jgi:adenylate kinase family enzyme
MRRITIGLYGMTCTGKTTLGTLLADFHVGGYTSFGGIIRDQVSKKSKGGRNIEEALAVQKPIPLELGWELLQSRFTSRLTFISGYPFRESELNCMARAGTPLSGWILLTANEESIQERLHGRSECPVCNRPADGGTVCKVHGLPFRARIDTRPEDVNKRRKVTDELVVPFLLSDRMRVLPNLSLDTSELNRVEVVSRANRWLKEFFAIQ